MLRLPYAAEALRLKIGPLSQRQGKALILWIAHSKASAPVPLPFPWSPSDPIYSGRDMFYKASRQLRLSQIQAELTI